MATTTIDSKDLAEWLWTLPESKYHLTSMFKSDSEEGEDHVSYFLSECSDLMRTFLQANGLVLSTPWNGRVLISCDPERFDVIEAEANAVREEYGEPEEIHELWDKYGLRGDDDVDYNGGYILIALDILRAYLTRED